MVETYPSSSISRHNTSLYTNEQIYNFALKFGCNMRDVYFLVASKSALVTMKNVKHIPQNSNVVSKTQLRSHMVKTLGVSKKFFSDHFNHFIDSAFVKNVNGELIEVISHKELNFDNRKHFVTASFPIHKMKNFNFHTFMKKSVEFFYGKPFFVKGNYEVITISQSEVARKCQISQEEVSKKTSKMDKIFKFKEVSKEEYLAIHAENKSAGSAFSRLLHINEVDGDRYLVMIGSKLVSNEICYSHMHVEGSSSKLIKENRNRGTSVVDNRVEVKMEILIENEEEGEGLKFEENDPDAVKVFNSKAFQIKAKSPLQALVKLTVARISMKCIEFVETKSTFRFNKTYLQNTNFNGFIKIVNYMYKELSERSADITDLKRIVRGFNVMTKHVKAEMKSIVEAFSTYSIINPNTTPRFVG